LVLASVMMLGCTGQQPPATSPTTPPVTPITPPTNPTAAQPNATPPAPAENNTQIIAQNQPTLLPVAYVTETIQGERITMLNTIFAKGTVIEPIILGSGGNFQKTAKQLGFSLLGKTYTIDSYDIRSMANAQGSLLSVMENTKLKSGTEIVPVQNLVLVRNNDDNYLIEEIGIGYAGNCLSVNSAMYMRLGIGKFDEMCVNGVKAYAKDVIYVAGTGKYAQLEFTSSSGKETKKVYIGESIESAGLKMKMMEMLQTTDRGDVAVFEVG